MKKAERLIKEKKRMEELLEPEKIIRNKGYRFTVGVDEAGRGPLAGPVVAAAVMFPEDFSLLGVDDSKKLSAGKREKLYSIIVREAVAYGVGIVDNETIDRINILNATKSAMLEAVNELETKLNKINAAGKKPLQRLTGTSRDADREDDSIKIEYIFFDAVAPEGIECPKEEVIKGDSKVFSVAAASIIAKVTRDRLMSEYAAEYSSYGFERNKGYGTLEHYDCLKKNGPCKIHRRSFLRNL